MVRFPLLKNTERNLSGAAESRNIKRVLLANVAQIHTLTVRGIKDYVGVTTQTEASQVKRSTEPAV